MDNTSIESALRQGSLKPQHIHYRRSVSPRQAGAIPSKALESIDNGILL